VRRLELPQLFLGLLALAVAIGVAASFATDAVRAVHPTGETVTVTGSARTPITSNLVQWTVTVNGDASTPALAARRLRLDLGTVERFLAAGGIPAAAVSLSGISSDVIVERLSKTQVRKTYRVSQDLDVSTSAIDVVERVAPRLGQLIERGISVSAAPLAYLSTELTKAKLDALGAATADAERRARIIVEGLGGKLGALRSSALGVYQITPPNSTNVSDYGINDTTTRDKDVTAVVSATFAVDH
jgi:hypothetical protein